MDTDDYLPNNHFFLPLFQTIPFYAGINCIPNSRQWCWWTSSWYSPLLILVHDEFNQKNWKLFKGLKDAPWPLSFHLTTTIPHIRMIQIKNTLSQCFLESSYDCKKNQPEDKTETPKMTEQKYRKSLNPWWYTKPKSFNQKSKLPMNVFICEVINCSISKQAWDRGLVSELKLIQMDLLYSYQRTLHMDQIIGLNNRAVTDSYQWTDTGNDSYTYKTCNSCHFLWLTSEKNNTRNESPN